jgi:hypothetical protein
MSGWGQTETPARISGMSGLALNSGHQGAQSATTEKCQEAMFSVLMTADLTRARGGLGKWRGRSR